MSILNWLRKLGIVRFGSYKGTYKNGKERPTELMMDGVYDAEKDLVNGEKKKKSKKPKKKKK